MPMVRLEDGYTHLILVSQCEKTSQPDIRHNLKTMFDSRTRLLADNNKPSHRSGKSHSP